MFGLGTIVSAAGDAAGYISKTIAPLPGDENGYNSRSSSFGEGEEIAALKDHISQIEKERRQTQEEFNELEADFQRCNNEFRRVLLDKETEIRASLLKEKGDGGGCCEVTDGVVEACEGCALLRSRLKEAEKGSGDHASGDSESRHGDVSDEAPRPRDEELEVLREQLETQKEIRRQMQASQEQEVRSLQERNQALSAELRAKEISAAVAVERQRNGSSAQENGDQTHNGGDLHRKGEESGDGTSSADVRAAEVRKFQALERENDALRGAIRVAKADLANAEQDKLAQVKRLTEDRDAVMGPGGAGDDAEVRSLRRQLASAEDSKLSLQNKCRMAEMEVRSGSERVSELEMQVEGLREGLGGAEEEAREMRRMNKVLSREAEEMQKSVADAFSELPDVYEIIAGTGAMQRGGGLGLVELVQGAVLALKKQVEEQQQWATQLRHFLAIHLEESAADTVFTENRVSALLELLGACKMSHGGDGTTTQELQEERGKGLALKAEVTQLRAKVQESVKREQDMKVEMISAQRTASQYKQIVNQMREMNKSQGGETEQFREENEGLTKRLQASEQEVLDLEGRLREALVFRIAAESADTERRSLEDTVKQLREQLSLGQTTSQSRTSNLTQELQSETQARSLLSQEAHELRTRISVAEADLAVAEQDRDRAETALHNLQSVLEQLQEERATDARVYEKRHRQELEEALRVSAAKDTAVRAVHDKQMQELRREREVELATHKRARAAKEGEVVRLREELGRLKSTLEEAAKRPAPGDNSAQLDRQLVSNLVVRYVVDRHSRRQVLELMARMFSFSDEQMVQVGLVKGEGGDIVGAVVGALIGGEEEGQQGEIQGETISEQWLHFLENG